ncbi:hypothetical protein [Desulfovibrio inopinatus]|uniref:hypothetical protein n=1 Tax=Desulfovibrio inopinatus TaxID=102109 RepID=UPI000423D4F2|nr:hypothetical protein [Desulfovibrio inopinatus]
MNTDMEMLDDMIGGIAQKLLECREQRDTLIRASTMEEQAAKARAEAEGLVEQIKNAKAELKRQKARKEDALAGTLSSLTATMSAYLPHGAAVIEIESGTVAFGWSMDGRTVPYAGLSGGQKAIFDAALAAALKATTIIVEAAEVDSTNLSAFLNTVEAANPETQIIINTCHAPERLPDGWEIVMINDKPHRIREEQGRCCLDGDFLPL